MHPPQYHRTPSVGISAAFATIGLGLITGAELGIQDPQHGTLMLPNFPTHPALFRKPEAHSRDNQMQCTYRKKERYIGLSNHQLHLKVHLGYLIS